MDEHTRFYRFNPQRVAYYEAAGWRAYYDRQWLKLIQLIVGLCQEQFAIPFPVSLLAAYYVTRAAAAWAPVDHNSAVVGGFYERFYRLARRYSGLRYNPAKAAALELLYNEEHRRLAGSPDKTSLVEALTALHSELFGLPPDRARHSAELRVQANNTVDRITGHTTTDVESDWSRLENYLQECYQSIKDVVEKQLA